MTTEADAYARLRDWAAGEGLNVGSVGGVDWQVANVDDVWILTPPGRSNVVYLVAGDAVRPVHPSRESLETVLADVLRGRQG